MAVRPHSPPPDRDPTQTPGHEAAFLKFAIDAGVLRFGSFTTKAGRQSPYFFNAGLFSNGSLLGRLAKFYALAFIAAEADGTWAADGLYGPAYKGIPLVSATAIALSEQGRDIGFSFNRKEAKDHGEGGTIVGAPLTGRIVIVDDVISAGTSVRESVEAIRAQGATPAGVLIALDRMERGGTAEQPSATSAVQEVWAQFGIPVRAIASLTGLLSFLQASKDPGLSQHQQAVQDYRERWGVSG
jgi:orotate phosphoribosyltransferase